MTRERLRQIEEIFHSARKHPAGQRDVFLSEACGADEELKSQVRSLLDQDSDGPIARPVIQAAADLLQAIRPGMLLGPYEIESRLGKGGMGEVYKARDTRLDRRVAIKTSDEEFNGRFKREARAISALNHPNICTLYDVGPNYLVMELLDGETLGTRLKKGPLPMSLVLSYAQQIAEGLAAAHAAGVIHRDLKPENIMLTRSGIKLLDFGLAKFEGVRSPSDATASLTESQQILGTPAYMAPEQVEAKPCDERTDIFALGLVLFEMAAGKRAFVGDSRAALMAGILRGEPPLKELPSLPFAHLVEGCLAKNPEERWQSVRDVKLQLTFLSRGTESPQSDAHQPEASRKRRVWPAAAAAVFVLGAAGLLVGVYSRSSGGAPTVVGITSYPGDEVTPSLSPDGTHVVFAWKKESSDNWDVYVKQIGPGNPRQLTSDRADDVQPRWSPDGNWIAFLRLQPDKTAGVYVAPASGGLEQKLGDATTASSGPRQALDWSPDGKWLVIGRRESPDSQSGLALLSRETGLTRQVTSPPAPFDDTRPVFAPDGHGLAFLRAAVGSAKRLMFLPLSRNLEPRGEAIRIQIGVNAPPTGFCWTADSRDLVTSVSEYEVAALLRVSPRGGTSRTLDFIHGAALDPFISRSGNRMVFTNLTFEANIWSLDLDAAGSAVGPPSKSFPSTRSEYNPEFSPDGAKVAFTSSRSGHGEIWVCASNGSACEQLTTLRSHAGSPQWSPDSKWIAFDTLSEDGLHVAVMSAAGGTPKLLATGILPRWSRNGRWLYFACAPALQICRMPASGGDAQAIPGALGIVAQESPDGNWLYYSPNGTSAGSTLRRVPLAGGKSVEVLPEVAGSHWVVTDSGIWYMTPGSGHHQLRYLDSSTGLARTVYETSQPIYSRLSLSPDRRRVLFTQVDRGPTSDLMLVENFR